MSIFLLKSRTRTALDMNTAIDVRLAYEYSYRCEITLRLISSVILTSEVSKEIDLSARKKTS